MERGSEGGRVRIGRKAREGKRGKRRVNGAREKGRREKEREKGERREGERALLASVVHVARALYMNVTQDVAVGLSCILCTPMLDLLNTMHDYDLLSEYHAHLRPIILNTMHASD